LQLCVAGLLQFVETGEQRGGGCALVYHLTQLGHQVVEGELFRIRRCAGPGTHGVNAFV